MKYKKLIIGCALTVLVASCGIVVGILLNKDDVKLIEPSSINMSEERAFVNYIEADSNFIFSKDGEFISVVGVNEPTEVLRIPTSYDNIPVSCIGISSFDGDKTVKEVIVEHPLSVFMGAFANSSVEKVSIIDEHGIIPDNDVSIYNEAFKDCKSLKEFECDAYVKGMSGGVFDGCDNLEKVVLKCPISWIPDYTFKDCKNLVSVFLPATVSSIADNAFEGCDKLESISGYSNPYAEEWAIEHGYEWNEVDD